MKRFSEYELEYLNHPERFTFPYFKTNKLDAHSAPVALSLADEELLNHYDNEYHLRTFQRTLFVPQLETTGPAYGLLEEYVAEMSAAVLSEHLPEEPDAADPRSEFSTFRRRLVQDLHSFPEIQKLQILKKIGIKIGYSPSAIDEVSRLFSAGSSLFVMELFLGLKRAEAWEAFLDVWPDSDAELREVTENPEILLPLWKHQIRAREQWISAGGKGIVQMATATGKTLVGLASAYHLYSVMGSLRVLVLCHSRAILNQWRREVIEKLGFIGDPDDDYTQPLSFQGKFVFSFATIQKVLRDPDKYYTDLLIVDEVHHGAGLKFRHALNVPCRWKMGLSATVEGRERIEVLDRYLGGPVFTYSLTDARKDGIIPEFKLVIHKTFLDIPEETEFASITEKITNLLGYINATQQQTIRSLSRNRYNRFEHIGDFVRLMKELRYRNDTIPEEWSHLIGLVNKRRWVIHRSSPKIAHAIDLAEKVAATHKCVLFAMDIASCERIAARLSRSVPSFLVHSNLKPEMVAHTLQRFRASKHGVLIAPKMLDEGIDIPDAEIGINVAASKTELQLIQRLGRILRNRPNKQPIFHHFVAVPRNYLVSEDSFTYQNDLAWITDVALKMGIPIEEVVDESEEFAAFERLSEGAISQYFSDYESLTTDDFGTIKIQNIVDAIHPEAQAKLFELLGRILDYLTDENWAELLRSAYGDEMMLDIPSHRWLLIIGERDPGMIRILLKRYGNVTSNAITPQGIPGSSIESHESSALASPAARSSGKIPLFIKMLEDNPSQSDRDRAISVLVREGSAAVEPLICLLSTRDQEVKKQVVGALGRIGDRRAVDPLIQCLHHSSSAIRQKAAQALGDIGDPRARLALTIRQRDRNPKVQKAVLKALEKLRD